MNYTLQHGDCLDILRTLPDNSVDAVVTDPPYGLSFMGKRWDYDVPSQNVWSECLRVLKPGGHLLAFAGTRTQHRMAVRIEDAGFEIRDMIAWVYGSGFPKSLDLSKAIDKMDAAEEQQARRYRFTAWVRSQGVTSKQIDEATATNMGGHYTTSASQPAIMTREHLEACRHLFQDIPSWVEAECDKRSVESRNFAEREVIGQDTKARSTSGASALPTMGGETVYQSWHITAPATPEARQWHGWGTALKPALEPITVARKPLIGTVAENVLTWGTGGVNVDGCRVAFEMVKADQKNFSPKAGVSKHDANKSDHLQGLQHITSAPDKQAAHQKTISLGRWPANLIHDGSEEATELLGDAQRFFYCAKASKRDRDEGCDGMPLAGGHLASDQGGGGGWKADAKDNPNLPRHNSHPTVKPTDLMRYLCRLVTPPEGTVLDPFMGSGSTGKAAMLEGFQFIGIEREAEYLDIARARIEHAINNKPNRLL